MKWYEKSMPSIKDVKPFLEETAKSFKSTKGIKSVYVFGSFAENIEKPRYNVKDIDLVVKSSFESGDFFAIDPENNYGILNKTAEELIEEGFEPNCAIFTKKCYNLKNTPFDIWAITKDRLVLHWGDMPESVEEWKEVRKIAESQAVLETSLKREKLCSASEEERKKWKTIYDEVIKNFVNNNSLGWYQSQSDPEEIISKSIQIA